MITKISNYVVNRKYNQPKIAYSYIVFTEIDSETSKWETISRNRDISIDVLLDNLPESHLDNRKDVSSDFQMNTIRPEIHTLNATYRFYTNKNDMESLVLKYLENLTSQPMVRNNSDIIIGNDDFYTVEAKINNKISSLMNRISMESRMGNPDTIIVGRRASRFFSGNINNIEFIISELIDIDKVIIMRASKETGNGLNVIDNPDDNIFYLSETPDWDKSIKWFTIK